MRGKNLGQFHSDFDLPCGHNSDIVSRRLLVLGPKVYVDDLECRNRGMEGKHYRMKGIPLHCVEPHKVTSVFDVYKDMLTGPYTFVLNPPGYVKFISQITGVTTRDSNTFTCTLDFSIINDVNIQLCRTP